MSLETFFLSALLPALAAFLAALLVRPRTGILALFGAGHLGNFLAGAVRGRLEVEASSALGLLDPFLWLFGGSLLVLLATRGAERAFGRWRNRPAK